jgi:signal transduction histidine kinase
MQAADCLYLRLEKAGTNRMPIGRTGQWSSMWRRKRLTSDRKPLPNQGSENRTALDKTEPFVAPDMPVWRRYLAALLCILTAFSLRYWLTPILGEELPFMLFISASLVAAWYGGAGAGIAALLLGLFLADYFFLMKAKSALTRSTEILYLIRYLFTASLGIALIETLHRSRRKLQREVARRERSEIALLHAQEQLKTHADELEQCVVRRTTELAATVKYLESLLYHIGHNLRAPLRAMEGYASVLVDEYAQKLDATAKDYSAHISDAAKRMDELIHDLLEYGRLGYVQIPMSNVNLGKVLERVRFRLGFEVRTKNAEINVVGPLPTIWANPGMLEHVITNLVENAIKFVAPGTRPIVEIRSEPRPSGTRLWIQDNGIGIAQPYLARIFNAFETLPSPQRFEGNGIGLAIVKQGMQRMGGQVGVESQPGSGSRFWIELPFASTAISSSNSPESFSSGKRNGHIDPQPRWRI